MDTRWHSKIDMLQSIIRAWDELEKLLRDRDQSDRLDNIDKETVQDLVRVLLPFKEAILDLEVKIFTY